MGELVNRALTALIIGTFLVLVTYGVLNMSWSALFATAQWSAAPAIIPYMLQVT